MWYTYISQIIIIIGFSWTLSHSRRNNQTQGCQSTALKYSPLNSEQTFIRCKCMFANNRKWQKLSTPWSHQCLDAALSISVEPETPLPLVSVKIPRHSYFTVMDISESHTYAHEQSSRRLFDNTLNLQRWWLLTQHIMYKVHYKGNRR